MPLSGTRVMIITNNDKNKGDQGLAMLVTALGGTLNPMTVPTPGHPANADVVLWDVQMADNHNNGSLSNNNGDDEVSMLSLLASLTTTQQTFLQGCLDRKVPILQASWLERVSGLKPFEHWSYIPKEPHIPTALTLFQQQQERLQQERKLQPHSSPSSKRDKPKKNNSAKAVLRAMKKAASNFMMDTLPHSASAGSTSSTRSWRRDKASNLTNSINETFTHLTRTNPNQMEEEAIRRAMELSMLDLALVFYQPKSANEAHHLGTTTPPNSSMHAQKQPHEILHLPHDATPDQIKGSYRKLARQHHPDKGGDSHTFDAIAKAYRTMLHLRSSNSAAATTTNGVSGDHGMDSTSARLKSTAHWDSELQDHRKLVNDLFQSHGENLQLAMAQQVEVLETLGLQVQEAGATNLNEKNEEIQNSCFYLSLAYSYLHGIQALILDNEDDMTTIKRTASGQDVNAALIGQTALQLKRVIEAAVLKAHPEWAAQGMVGEEVQAFSDFLTYSLDDGGALLSDWAVVVFDSVSGFCDIYKGSNYTKLASTNDAWGSSNTITLLYTPGHYQPLIVKPQPQASNATTTTRPSLEEVLKELDASGAFYVITDGS